MSELVKDPTGTPPEILTTPVDAEILSALRSLAEREGRDLQTLVEEALVSLLEKRNQPRPHVMAAYQASHERFGSLYKKLAE